MEFKNAWPFVVGAYMGIWTVLFIYVVVMQSKLSGIKKELALLGKALERRIGAK
ncbi:MAG TPA: CcmD family protein [Anaerolineae bacterium]|jgi:CcmD family protein|nr:CcmD family protein [Anaerolineae bacterium]